METPAGADDIPGPTLLFHAIFENALDAMLLADDEGVCLDANPAACALTGYEREELLGLTGADLSADSGAFASAWSAFLAAGRAEGTYRLRRRDGLVVETEFRAVADIEAGVHLSVMHDVTERVHAERRAAERGERVDLVLEQLPAVLWTTDESLAFTFVGGAPARGVAADRLPAVRDGRTVDGYADTEDDVRATIAAHLEALAGNDARFQGTFRGTVWRCHVEPLRDRSGANVGTIGVGFDVTEAERMRRELEATVETLSVLETQRRQLIGELLTARADERRRLSRELHDGLGQIMTTIKLLVIGLRQAPPEEVRAGLEDIHDLVQKGAESARDVVGHLREESAEDPTLRVALLRLAAETEGRHGLPIEVSADVSGLLPVPVATAAHRVASEALTNAIKHAGATGVSVVVMTVEGRLVLVIEDDGVGFDPRHVAASARGHGLIGMRERVEELGGTLTVAAAPGRGTTIRAELPVEG